VCEQCNGRGTKGPWLMISIPSLVAFLLFTSVGLGAHYKAHYGAHHSSASLGQ